MIRRTAGLASDVLVWLTLAVGGMQAQGAATAQDPRGNDTTAGNARDQGVTAKPSTASLPSGTFDLGNGLTFLLNYTSESAANPIGGIRQGTDRGAGASPLRSDHSGFGDRAGRLAQSAAGSSVPAF